jgi:hypothetical protein
MRLVATISPWLPWLQGILPYSVLLGGKAAELYYSSILEKPLPPLLARETVFGMASGGKASKAFHEHLLDQGFQPRSLACAGKKSRPAYFREDLGYLEFRCPETRNRKSPYREGLLAMPDANAGLLLEDPHEVELKYLGRKYSVRIPQTGRLVLAQGLDLGRPSGAGADGTYRVSQCLTVIFFLLVLNPELQEEALNDLAEVKPASLVQQFRQNLKDHGPGTPSWEAGRRFFLELFPEAKAVELTSWYWKFLNQLGTTFREMKTKGRQR